MEKSPAALTRPCFEACRLGTEFPPVALALGASDAYKTIMRQLIHPVKGNVPIQMIQEWPRHEF